jgi:hypothetical protein
VIVSTLLTSARKAKVLGSNADAATTFGNDLQGLSAELRRGLEQFQTLQEEYGVTLRSELEKHAEYGREVSRVADVRLRRLPDPTLPLSTRRFRPFPSSQSPSAGRSSKARPTPRRQTSPSERCRTRCRRACGNGRRPSARGRARWWRICSSINRAISQW